MYNRKHPKQSITPVQMQVLYNSILEAVNQISNKNGQPEAIAVVSQPQPTISAQSHKVVPKVAAEAIMRKYIEDRRCCSGEDEYMTWLEKLQNDPRLTDEQKEEIKTTR